MFLYLIITEYYSTLRCNESFHHHSMCIPFRSSGVFLKLFGVTIIGTAGAVGYVWYDPGFRQTVESNIPYTREALQWLFQYLPDDKSKLSPIESAEKARYECLNVEYERLIVFYSTVMYGISNLYLVNCAKHSYFLVKSTFSLYNHLVF